MTDAVFYFFAAVAVLAAVLCITQKSPVASALWLICTMFSLAAIYLILNAHFIAAIQVLVYAGAIMVLFLFVVMLLNVPTEERPSGHHARLLGGAGPRRFGAALALLLAIELFWAFQRLQATPMPPASQRAATVAEIGSRLFKQYTFAFEATSLLILVAMVGAIVLARRETRR